MTIFIAMENIFLNNNHEIYSTIKCLLLTLTLKIKEIDETVSSSYFKFFPEHCQTSRNIFASCFWPLSSSWKWGSSLNYFKYFQKIKCLVYKCLFSSVLTYRFYCHWSSLFWRTMKASIFLLVQTIPKAIPNPNPYPNPYPYPIL